MYRLGVEAKPGAVPLANCFEFVEVVLRDDTLTVVADHNGVRLAEACVDLLDQSLGQSRCDVDSCLAIDTDHLLPLRDDSCFATGLSGCIGDQRVAVHSIGF